MTQSSVRRNEGVIRVEMYRQVHRRPVGVSSLPVVTGTVLTAHTPDIVRYINFVALTPHLFARRLLTLDEFREMLDSDKPTTERVARMLTILRSKGPDWPQLFVDGLVRASEHIGHQYLLDQLSNQFLIKY